MKPKHQNLSAVSVLIVGLLAALGYAVYHFRFVGSDLIVAPPPAIAQINVPTPQEISVMGELQQKFLSLALPNESISGPVALEIFGYRPSDNSLAAKGRHLDEASQQPDYTLTFTFSSGSRRFCIINGVFYPKGGQLPDGAQILQIDAHKVLLSRNGRQIWIPLAVPGDVDDARTISKKP